MKTTRYMAFKLMQTVKDKLYRLDAAFWQLTDTNNFFDLVDALSDADELFLGSYVAALESKVKGSTPSVKISAAKWVLRNVLRYIKNGEKFVKQLNTAKAKDSFKNFVTDYGLAEGTEFKGYSMATLASDMETDFWETFTDTRETTTKSLKVPGVASLFGQFFENVAFGADASPT